MSSTSIVLLPTFLSEAQELAKESKPKLVKTLDMLSRDARHPGLQTKKLKGNSASIFECRVDQSIRLIYDISGGLIRCWHVGAHDKTLAKGSELSPEGIDVDDIEIQEYPETNWICYIQQGYEPSETTMMPLEAVLDLLTV